MKILATLSFIALLFTGQAHAQGSVRRVPPKKQAVISGGVICHDNSGCAYRCLPRQGLCATIEGACAAPEEGLAHYSGGNQLIMSFPARSDLTCGVPREMYYSPLKGCLERAQAILDYCYTGPDFYDGRNTTLAECARRSREYRAACYQ